MLVLKRENQKKLCFFVFLNGYDQSRSQKAKKREFFWFLRLFNAETKPQMVKNQKKH
jgi:hypothetical protein